MKIIFKKIYSWLPFKKELFNIIKCFNIPNSIFKHLAFKGEFTVKIRKNCSFKMFHYGYQLENELFWKGLKGWEKESIACWLHEAENSNTIFDIGANTGIYSLLAKAININAEVYAFEPVERVYEKLNKNIQINLFNIKTYPIAISNKTGTSEIWDFKFEHEYAASLIKPENNSDIYTSYKVPITSLDDFIEKNRISKIDLIKIDVETYEPHVLEGYSKYFSVHKPTLLIEVLYDHIGEQIQSFIEKSGVNYDYYFIDEEKGLVKKDLIRRCSNIYFNYFLKPRNNSL